MPAPEEIKKNVVDQLYWDVRVDASDVEVSVDDGTVTLTGKVPSYSASQAATTTVWSVDGVTAVENNLNIEAPSAVDLPSDSDIQSNIESMLLWNSEIDSTIVDVRVENGIVTLEGTIDAYWKKVRAEELSDVTGVLSVVNKLGVVPTEDVVDEDIAQDVTDALERSISVNVDDITVKVKDSKVTLTGVVPSWTAFRAAEDSAFYTLGVTEVDNRLTIQY
jgi:osmotically-inducible protein OsmY